MIRQICILTKSYKHGGYCVAGIDINTKEWIRLVNSDNPNADEIRKEQMILGCKSIECLDVIECDFIKHIPNNCQVENWLLNTSAKPRFIKSLTIEQFVNLINIDKENYFIFNKENLLNADEIANVNRSLYIFHVRDLKIEASTYESYGEIRFKYKCSFNYNDNQYSNISLTDPVYRDTSQDGLNLSNALIIASLPCVPYNDNLYYKFVAKIIPINEHLASYLGNINDESNNITNIKDKSTISPFVKFDLVIHAQQTPGIVLFENYEQLKQNISNGVAYYSEFEYTLDNYQVALKHHNELKYVKNILEKTKREIVKSYNAPLEVVEKKLEDLINLIKAPFKKIDTFIKQNKQNSKKYEIYLFAKGLAISNGLQEHMENIFKSPAFFEVKWLNASCSKSSWKTAVTSKIKNAARDINQILSILGDNTASILAHYYQTLSMSKVDEFVNSLKSATNIAEKSSPVNITRPRLIDNVPHEIQITSNTNEIINRDLKDYEILNSIASSVNPYTGEVISGIDNCLKLKLEEISLKLERIIKQDINDCAINSAKTKTNLQHDEDFPMAWEKWTKQEDARLIDEFNQGLTIKQIAEIHNRKTGGIRSRLKKHNLID